MRNALITLCGFSAVGSLLLAGPTHAARRSEMEKSLLGIRVLQTYKTVLARFGPPTRIYRYGETVLTVASVDANGNPTGGIRALDDGAGGGLAGNAGFGGGMGGRPGGMPGMGGRFPGMPGGMPGMSGGMGGPPMGGPSMAGSSGAMGGFPGMPGMSGGMGGPPMGGPSMGGPSGAMGRFSGMPGGMSGMPGGMGGGGLGAANVPQGGGATFAQSGGFMWVYFYPKQELMYWFLFNTDGRVVAIVEKGRNQGKPTSRGISLGDSVKSIYQQYGWPDSMDQQGDAMALHYSARSHVEFHIINNKVTEIAVFLTEDQRAIESNTVGGGMRPGMMGGMGSGGMRPGMMGGMGGGMRPGMAGMGGAGMPTGGKGGEGD